MKRGAPLRRRRAASIAGYARVANANPDELDAMRRKGGEVRGGQLRGRSDWGKHMAEAKRLRRYGPHLTTDQRLATIERRLDRLEATHAKPRRRTAS